MISRRSLVTGVLGAFVAPTALLANNTKPIISGRGFYTSLFLVDEFPYLSKTNTNSLSSTPSPDKSNIKSDGIYGFDYLVHSTNKYREALIKHKFIILKPHG